MAFCILIMSELLGQPYQHAPFVFYFLLLASLIYPFDTTRVFREFAVLFGRVLWLVFFPGTEVHFLEVLVGDILTSMSKVFFEMGLACVATLLALSPTFFRVLSPDILPTLMATTPFILRIRQCLVQHRGATSEKSRFLISLNILKYCSSIPGLWLPLLLAPHYATRQIERVLLWVLLVNSLYSFLWDVIMDWGLGHINLNSSSSSSSGSSRKGGGGERSPSSRLRHWGLRPTLLFGSAGSYYAAIGLDLVLRLVWVLKYVEFDHRLSYDKFMLLIEGLEVLRRGVWSIYRIEWECLNLTGGRKVEGGGGGGISMVGVGGGGKGGLLVGGGGGGGGVGGGKGVVGHGSDEDVDLERSSGVDEDEDGMEVTSKLLSR
jgi:myo-inositol-1(or 4)-monophosphatase